MTLIHSAIRGGIFDRAVDLCKDAVDAVDAQIETGAASIRADRIWRYRKRVRKAYGRRG